MALMLAGCGARLSAVPDVDSSTIDTGASEPEAGLEASTPDAFVPDVVETEAPAFDSAMPDVPPFDAAAPCTTSITGAEPVGVSLAGAVRFDDPSFPESRTVTALLFLPKGRVPGARVILARPKTGRPGWDVTSSNLDASLGAKLTVTDEHCGDAIEGTLLGPDDGILARVKVNPTAPWADAVVTKPGSAKLCSSGPIKTPMLQVPVCHWPLRSA